MALIGKQVLGRKTAKLLEMFGYFHPALTALWEVGGRLCDYCHAHPEGGDGKRNFRRSLSHLKCNDVKFSLGLDLNLRCLWFYAVFSY